MCEAMGSAEVLYLDTGLSFVADIYRVGDCNVVRTLNLGDKLPLKPEYAATHHLVRVDDSGFWREDLGIFVVPESWVSVIRARTGGA